MWQWGVRSCNMPGLPEHLVQELNVGTIAISHIAMHDHSAIGEAPGCAKSTNYPLSELLTKSVLKVH